MKDRAVSPRTQRRTRSDGMFFCSSQGVRGREWTLGRGWLEGMVRPIRGAFEGWLDHQRRL